jgi:hypothetical protein
MSSQELDKEVKDEWGKIIPLSKILIRFLPLKERLPSYDSLISPIQASSQTGLWTKDCQQYFEILTNIQWYMKTKVRSLQPK